VRVWWSLFSIKSLSNAYRVPTKAEIWFLVWVKTRSKSHELKRRETAVTPFVINGCQHDREVLPVDRTLDLFGFHVDCIHYDWAAVNLKLYDRGATHCILNQNVVTSAYIFPRMPVVCSANVPARLFETKVFAQISRRLLKSDNL